MVTFVRENEHFCARFPANFLIDLGDTYEDLTY